MRELLDQAKQGILQDPYNAIGFFIFVILFLLVLGIHPMFVGNYKKYLIILVATLLAASGTFFMYFT